MSSLVAIILGFVEGATEFIPVSSTGHLILIRQFLGQNNSTGLAFDAVLQLASSLAIIVYFWRDIVRIVGSAYYLLTNRYIDNKDKTLIYSILIGTVPAIILGLLLENYMDTVFRNAKLVALTLILGSLLFYIAEKFSKENKVLTLGRGVLIGFFQCLALVPGISRSGATISGGLLLGLSKEDTVRFSFLLSIPILLGAGIKKLYEVRADVFGTELGTALLLGSLTAFIVGLLSISFLIRYLKNHNLNLFIWYRVALAVIILFAVS